MTWMKAASKNNFVAFTGTVLSTVIKHSALQPPYRGIYRRRREPLLAVRAMPD